MAKKRAGKDQNVLLSALLMVVAFVVCYLVLVAALTPQRYDVKVGDVAQQTISAPRAMEDEAATNALRLAARSDARDVYRLDDALVEQHVLGANSFFDEVNLFRKEAQLLSEERIPNDTLGDPPPLTGQEWREILPEQDINSLLSKVGVLLLADEGYYLLTVSESDLLRFKDAVLPKLTTSLRAGLQESNIPARKTAYVQELYATSLPDSLKQIGEKVLEAFLRPTYVLDEKATEEAKAAAAQNVEPVQIKRGDVIVEKDSTITQEQYDLLSAFELVRAEQSDTPRNIGLALYILCIAVCFVLYLLFFQQSVFKSPRTMLIICVSMVLSMLLTFASGFVDRRLSATMIGVIMVALLVNEKTALAVNFVLAMCAGLIAGGTGAALMGFNSMVMTVSLLMGGQAAVYMLRRYNKRATIIAAGVGAGVVCSVVIVAACVMTGQPTLDTLICVAYALGGSVLAAVLVAGTLSLWETWFDVATSARLNELSNTNNELLRQLMTEAPGTYHHSMMTATLSESAAEAIGADALLARVGAYYHDVGKLRRPIYFKENQKPNENIHDTLSPGESATIIIAHQKDGVTLLNKHKLPSAVTQIAFEHHGTTLAAYFYYKAMKETGNNQLSPKLFRYPGARPSTKESAIVMLADSCEAAVRSLESPSREEVEALVDKIIKGKMEDGQLLVCPLTFKELAAIQQSFLRTFNGILHERIAYPGQERPGETK